MIHNVNHQEYVKSVTSQGSYFSSKWTPCSLVDEHSNMLCQSIIETFFSSNFIYKTIILSDRERHSSISVPCVGRQAEKGSPLFLFAVSWSRGVLIQCMQIILLFPSPYLKKALGSCSSM
jgi:hypothetical protein